MSSLSWDSGVGEVDLLSAYDGDHMKFVADCARMADDVLAQPTFAKYLEVIRSMPSMRLPLIVWQNKSRRASGYRSDTREHKAISQVIWSAKSAHDCLGCKQNAKATGQNASRS